MVGLYFRRPAFHFRYWQDNLLNRPSVACLAHSVHKCRKQFLNFLNLRTYDKSTIRGICILLVIVPVVIFGRKEIPEWQYLCNDGSPEMLLIVKTLYEINCIIFLRLRSVKYHRSVLFACVRSLLIN